MLGFLIVESGPVSAKPAHHSPNRPFLSGALDSANSVRSSKFQRFEGPMNFNEKRFCGSSRTGESIRFQFAISRFESSRPSQPVRRQEILPSVIPEMPANGGLLRSCGRSPDSKFGHFQGEIADSLRRIFEIFPFLGDGGWRPGSICTAWRAGQCNSTLDVGKFRRSHRPPAKGTAGFDCGAFRGRAFERAQPFGFRVRVRAVGDR